jgi:hypothetical protein
MKQKITKIDAAYRQLKTAIHLFFDEKDPVSIHTLACAALQIFQDQVGNDTEKIKKLALHYHAPHIRDTQRKKVAEVLRAPRNFFKHATSGVNEISFNPEINPLVICDAINTYTALGFKAFEEPYFMIFNLWFIARYPDLFIKDSEVEAIFEIAKTFDHSDMNFYLQMLKTADAHPEEMSEIIAKAKFKTEQNKTT